MDRLGNTSMMMLSPFKALLLCTGCTLLALVGVLTLYAATDISNTDYTVQLTATNTSGGALAGQAGPFPLSAAALIDAGIINSGARNSIVQFGEDVPAMPSSQRIDVAGALADDGGVTGDETSAATNATANDMTLLPASPASGDSYTFFMDHPGRVLTLNIGTAGSGDWTLAWEYWDGNQYRAVANVDDRTNAFKRSGLRSVSFDLPTDWTETTESGITGFPLRARVNNNPASIDTQPLGTQAFYETGVWWVFIDNLDPNEQKTFTMYLGGTADLVSSHAFFPGNAGITTPDDPSIELGNTYTIRIDGFLPFSTTGDTSRLVFKEGTPGSGDPVSIFISDVGEITARISDGVTTSDLVVSGITSGDHEVELAGSDTLTALTVIGVGSDTTGDISLFDSTGDWQFVTTGSMVYFNDITIFGGAESEITLFTTDADWDTGTHNETDAVSGSLELEANTAVGDGNPPVDWASLDGAGIGGNNWTTTIATDQAQFGSRSFKAEETGAIQSDNLFLASEIAPASSGETWSASAWVRAAGNVFGSDLDYILRLEFMNGAAVAATHTDTTNDVTADLTWTEVQTDGNVAPSTADGVRVRLQIDCTNSTCSDDVVTWWDGVLLAEAAVAPDFPNINNVLANPSFEVVFEASGDWISPTITSTADNVLSTQVDWTLALPAGAVATGESSIDDQASWQALTNGGSISGITPGDSLVGTNINIRLTMEPTSDGDDTPSFADLTVTIRDSSSGDQVLFYQLNTTPGLTIEDRSTNSNNGTTSFPTVPTTFTTSTASLVPRDKVDNLSSEVTVPGVVDEIGELTNLFGTGDFSSLPLFDVLNTGATNSGVPVNFFLRLLAGTFLFLVAFWMWRATQNLILVAITVGGGILAMSLIGTGLLPLWVVFIFGFLATAIIIGERRLGL